MATALCQLGSLLKCDVIMSVSRESQLLQRRRHDDFALAPNLKPSKHLFPSRKHAKQIYISTLRTISSSTICVSTSCDVYIKSCKTKLIKALFLLKGLTFRVYIAAIEPRCRVTFKTRRRNCLQNELLSLCWTNYK